MSNPDLYKEYFGPGWNLECDSKVFEYVAKQFDTHRSTQNWVACWLDLQCHASFFVDPDDSERITHLHALQGGGRIADSIAVYEAEGESLAVYVLAERSGALEMAPAAIPEWLVKTNSVIVASIALYAFGTHGKRMAEEGKWDELDQFVRSVIQSTRPSMIAWWNALVALKMIFQAKNRGSPYAAYKTLDWAFSSAAKYLVSDLDEFLARLAPPSNPCHFDAILVCMLEDYPSIRTEILRFIFCRIEALQCKRSPPSLIDTYLDFYYANALALAFILEESYQPNLRRGWLRDQLEQRVHPACAWDRDKNPFEYGRWSLWLFTMACMAILRTESNHGSWQDSYMSFLRSVSVIGRGKFWEWRRWLHGRDELDGDSAGYFVQVLTRHPEVTNELQLVEDLVLGAPSPDQLDLLQTLMEIAPPDVSARCAAHRSRLARWWSAI